MTPSSRAGRPYIVSPREVAKTTQAYRTDPEILLACIIVSGTARYRCRSQDEMQLLIVLTVRKGWETTWTWFVDSFRQYFVTKFSDPQYRR
jgi:hypothetical protein